MSIQKIKRKSKPFLVRCKNIDGKIISATFATRTEAEEFELSNKAEKKMPSELQIDGVERGDVAKIKKLCAEYGLSLHDAVPMFQKFLKDSQRPTLLFPDAQTKFLAFLEAKKVRPRTYGFYENHTKRFLKWCNACGFYEASHFSAESAQMYMDAVRSKPQAKRALRAFWSFLCDSGYAAENVFKKVKIPKILGDKAEIQIMTPKETEANINAIRPEFKPLYALMAFAGIRPEELIYDKSDKNAKSDCFKFSDIDFERKRIIVRASVAKTRETRIITGLANIWPWLEPIKGWKTIYPSEMTMLRPVGKRTTTKNVYQQWIQSKKTLPYPIPQDALRHSFASYAYHVFGVEKAVEILGHDYKVYKKFYKAVATEEDSKAYFSIVPDSMLIKR